MSVSQISKFSLTKFHKNRLLYDYFLLMYIIAKEMPWPILNKSSESFKICRTKLSLATYQKSFSRFIFAFIKIRLFESKVRKH